LNRDKKIQAFTLNELIVVMVITVVVIGLVYSVLSLVQSHMKGISYNLGNATEANLMEQALTLDFNTYHQAEVSQSGQIFFKNELDSIAYEIGENLLIRETDTFDITVGGVEFFLDNNVITSGKFNAIKVSISPEEKKEDIFIYKQNDAKTYMD